MGRILSPGATHGQSLRSRRFAGFNLIEAEFPARSAIPAHGHQNAFFRLILEGQSDDVTSGQTFAGGPSTMVYHPPGEEHSNYWPGYGRSLVLELSSDAWGRCRDLAPLPAERSAYRSGPLVSLAKQLHEELRHPDAASSLAMEGLALELIAAASRDANQLHSRVPVWLRKVEQALQDRSGEALSIGEISGVAGVHPGHLARVFRRHFRCTPGEYAPPEDRPREAAARGGGRPDPRDRPGCGVLRSEPLHHGFQASRRVDPGRVPAVVPVAQVPRRGASPFKTPTGD